MEEKTLANPTWVHFGKGNIFRGFIAQLQHSLLGQKEAETGILAVDTLLILAKSGHSLWRNHKIIPS